MVCSRREWVVGLPLAFAVVGSEQEKEAVPSKLYRFKDLPVRARGQSNFRDVLEGTTHSGLEIELHETELGPGETPHPPHRHRHEEMFLIREGELDVTIGSRTERLGPGSVAFVAASDWHEIRNAGPGSAQYFVVALGRD